MVPPKSSTLIGFSIINYPFWGTPILGNTHIVDDGIFVEKILRTKKGAEKESAQTEGASLLRKIEASQPFGLVA